MFEQVLDQNSLQTQSYTALEAYGLGVNNQGLTNTTSSLDFQELKTRFLEFEESPTPVANLGISDEYGDNPFDGFNISAIVAKLPVVTIKASDNLASETNQGQTPNNGRFTVTRTGNLSKSLTVFYSIAGTASNGQDYNNLTSSVKIAAGKSSAQITITPKNDQLVENQETVTLTLTGNNNYVLGANKQATVKINDNDTAEPGPSREWIEQTGSNKNENFLGVDTDAQGNLYLAGWTGDTNQGVGDAVIAKYDTNGRELWTREFGFPNYQDSQYFATYTEQFDDVAVDSNGNVYAIGTVKTDVIDINVPNDPNDDEYFYDFDILLVKYSSNGTQLWFNTYGSWINDNGYSVTVDKNNNLYIAGNADALDGNSALVARIDPDDGAIIWDQYYGASELDAAYGITTDSAGNVYATGMVENGIAEYDIWVAKYTSNGTLSWVRERDAGEDNENSTDIQVDGNGNVYISVAQTIYGGPEIQYNGALIKYNTQGVWQWTKSYGTNNDDYQSLALDSKGNIYLTGPKIVRESIQGSIVKVDSTGKFIWEETIKANDGDVFVNHLAIDKNDNLFVAGNTDGTLNGPKLGGGDMWFAKYNI